MLKKKIDDEEGGEVGAETINLRRKVRLKRRTNQITPIVSHKDDDFDRGILVQANFLILRSIGLQYQCIIGDAEFSSLYITATLISTIASPP